MVTKFGRAAVLAGALFFIAFGGWALLLPRSFFERVATWPPFNDHLMRDAGAFQLGIGIGLAAALLPLSGTVAALVGATAAAILHTVSHVVDYGDGGRSSDPYTLGIVALVLGVALFTEIRSVIVSPRHRDRPGRGAPNEPNGAPSP